MSDSLSQHPGLLGYGGIIAIHADWPNYPRGLGWEIALRNLGSFPPDSHFFELDDIDQCKLLIPTEPIGKEDYFEPKFYHIALWIQDICNLKEKGYITGITRKSDLSYRLISFQRFIEASIDSMAEIGGQFIEDEKGNFILKMHSKEFFLEKPTRDSFIGDEDYDPGIILSESISITSKGWEKLLEISQEISLHPELEERVRPLEKLGLFDTAVRESSVMLETKIKSFHNVELFGQRLVEHHINEIIKSQKGYLSAAVKCYRGELRAAFKFIRNPFAHNLKELSVAQFRAILYRINDVYLEFFEVKEAYFPNTQNDGP